MKKPNRHRHMTSAVYTMRTESKLGKNGQPKRRERLTYLTTHKKPKSEEFEPSDHIASEVDDLANDDFFYEQLDKNKPTTESSVEVEEVHEVQPHVNRDVVLIHGSKDKRRGKQHQKMIHFNYESPKATQQPNDDIYDDYGEMEMKDADVEMHDTFEQNTKEGHAQHANDGRLNKPLNFAPVMHTYDARPHYIPTQRPKSRKKNPPRSNARPRPTPSTNQNRHIPTRKSKVNNLNPPTQKQKYDQIKITKKLNSPDELHAEIDKIFQKKNANYNKRGHQNAHWELSIMPIDYKTHEEFSDI